MIRVKAFKLAKAINPLARRAGIRKPALNTKGTMKNPVANGGVRNLYSKGKMSSGTAPFKPQTHIPSVSPIKFNKGK